MSDPLDLTGIRGLDPSLPDTCTLEATLVTGFEPTAAEELLEKMGLTANMSRGRIVFDIAVDRVSTGQLLPCPPSKTAALLNCYLLLWPFNSQPVPPT